MLKCVSHCLSTVSLLHVIVLVYIILSGSLLPPYSIHRCKSFCFANNIIIDDDIIELIRMVNKTCWNVRGWWKIYRNVMILSSYG